MSYHTSFFSEIIEGIDELLHYAQMDLYIGVTPGNHNVTN
jgi:hypothetical protein